MEMEFPLQQKIATTTLLILYVEGKHVNHWEVFTGHSRLNPCRMTSVEKRFRLNRILLIIFGLWPYQQSNLVRLQLALLFGILMGFIAFQVFRYFLILTFSDLFTFRSMIYRK